MVTGIADYVKIVLCRENRFERLMDNELVTFELRVWVWYFQRSSIRCAPVVECKCEIVRLLGMEQEGGGGQYERQ